MAFAENRAEGTISPVSRVLNEAENSPLLLKYAALLIGILAVMAFGIRPALRGIAAAVKNLPAGMPRELAAGHKAALHPPEPPPVDPERTRAQQILEEVSGHLQREPTQSSRLLQSWIHSE
jgi:flagellar M-ring protein FliF